MGTHDRRKPGDHAPRTGPADGAAGEAAGGAAGEAAAPTRAAAPDLIVIRDLKVQAMIGLLPQERGVRQGLRFDVEVETVPDYARTLRETGAYLCYGAIADFITGRAAAQEHVDLVETWAEDVAAFVLADPLAARVTVRVEKTDIVPEAAGVGICITRERAA